MIIIPLLPEKSANEKYEIFCNTLDTVCQQQLTLATNHWNQIKDLENCDLYVCDFHVTTN